jgi:hypothetical protein
MTARLTPLQIAVLSLAHASIAAHPPTAKNVRHPEDVIAVWGSWQAAADKLRRETPSLLALLGTAAGTRELEWLTLAGRQRRGPAGRTVHLYRLERRAVPLAARCAWAIEHLPADRRIAVWRDVPGDLPAPRTGGRCPDCGCEPSRPCTILLTDGRGKGSCTPAGVYGFKRCSGCQLRTAA